MTARVWTVVVPVKSAARGKTRLGAPESVTRAIALDTIAAVAACDRVSRTVVVTDDDSIAAELADTLDVRAEPETDSTDDAALDAERGLHAAVRAGLQGAAGPVAIVHADLPALDPADLADVLDAASTHPLGVVSDAEGEGSTVLTALDPDRLQPLFGRGSFRRHAERGHASLPAAQSVRRDVDTPEQLAALASRGPLGPRTAAALRASLEINLHADISEN